MDQAFSTREDSDGWEYEYHPTETENFLVDVDLTSINRPVMSANATKAKKGLKFSEKPKLQNKGRSAKKANAPDNGEAHDDGQSAGQSSSQANEQARGEDRLGENVQVLDFHTDNPIISYRGNLYSCTWTDMVGTTMLFSKHESSPTFRPTISTTDYDVLGTTRIKLVGNRATVTPLEPGDKGATEEDDSVMRPGAGLGDLKTTNPKINTNIRKQANFLEQLMDVKKARGEQDIVRTVANQKVASLSSTSGVQSPAKRKQLDQLNRKAIKGDGQAVKKLKSIYSGLDGTISEEDEDPSQPATPAIRPQRSRRTRRTMDSGSPSEVDEESSKEIQTPASEASTVSSQDQIQSTDGEYG